MLKLESPADLATYAGKVLGVSAWRTVTQAMVDDFARCTGDDNWIHIDTDRAHRELPGGITIAHGFLTLSLTPVMMRDILTVAHVGRAINYGVDNLRFPAPVAVGSRVRLEIVLKDATLRDDGGYKFVLHSTVEIEGQQRPAAVFDKLLLLYPS